MSPIKLSSALILCLCMLLSPFTVLAASPVPEQLSDNGIPIVNITIDEEAEGYDLITPEDAQEKSAAWSSSDESVAEMDEKGVVTMKQTGETIITAALRSGYSRSIVASVSPQPCTSDVNYYCDGEGEIISYPQYGVFQALSVGTATVTVSISEDITAECTVIVTEGDKPAQQRLLGDA